VVSYRACHANADVVLVKVKDGGHLSPGHPSALTPVSLVNPTDMDIDGTVVAWNFLSRYHLK
jgi:poly(3-hydroxybutyrate) depolymerase